MPKFTIQVKRGALPYRDEFDVDAENKNDAERQGEYLLECVGVKSIRAVKCLADRQVDNAKIRLGVQPVPEDTRIFNRPGNDKPIKEFFFPHFVAYTNTGQIDLEYAGTWENALYQAAGYAEAHDCMVEVISDGKIDRKVEYPADGSQIRYAP